MPDFRIIPGDVPIRVAVEGTGPLVLFVHGWPESWYSWRHQLGPVAAAGFTAAAIDVRGYGGSGKPHEIAAYDMESITGDVARVAAVLGNGAPAILVGHDWGAPIVWNSALTRPDEFSAVAGMSVPYTGIPARPFTDLIRHVFTDQGKFFYQAWFQNVGPPEAELEADVRGFLRRILYAISGDAPPGTWPDKAHGATLLEGMVDPAEFPAWLSDADLDYYTAEFEASGLRGPLNRYRNHERDFAWLQTFAGRRIEQPALFIGGSRDPATYLFGAITDPIETMRPNAPRIEGHVLKGCGHWTQQERPAEVTAILLDWLERVR